MVITDKREHVKPYLDRTIAVEQDEPGFLARLDEAIVVLEQIRHLRRAISCLPVNLQAPLHDALNGAEATASVPLTEWWAHMRSDYPRTVH
jgi:hypothetical protein